MNAKLTEGSVELRLAQLTLPLIGGVFALIAFNLADTYYVAQLGAKELAAIGFTFPVVMVLGSIAMGLGVGTSSIVARTLGQDEDRRRARNLTTNSLILSLPIVTTVVWAGWATTARLFGALGAGPDVLPLIQDYMSIWYFGTIFLVIPIIGNSAIRALGNTVVPSLIMVVAAAINLVLDPVFIFGWGGVPAMGLQGAATATVISRAMTLVASLAFLHYREKMLGFTRPKLKETLLAWRDILFVGLPAAATNSISPLAAGLVTSLVARYGSEAVAGFGLATKIEAFVLIGPIALAAAIAPFVGQNGGAGNRARVDRALRSSFIFVLGWGVAIAIVLGATAPWIASQFDNNPAVTAIATTYLTIVPIGYGALGIVLVAGSVLNALGKPLSSAAITLGRLLLLYVPLAFVGNQFFGIKGVFVATCMANTIAGVTAFSWRQRISNLGALDRTQANGTASEKSLEPA